MAIYCGLDFHPRQHSVCYCDVADGEVHYRELHYEHDDLRRFYSQFPGELFAGLEASGYSAWFGSVLGCRVHAVVRCGALSAPNPVVRYS